MRLLCWLICGIIQPWARTSNVLARSSHVLIGWNRFERPLIQDLNTNINHKREVCGFNLIPRLGSCSYSAVNGVEVRGGTQLSDGEEYDNLEYDDYDEYDEEEPYPPPRRRHPASVPPTQNNKRRRRMQQTGDENSAAAALNLAVDVAKKTANVATTTAVSSIKGSTRAALHLASPKFVSRKEILGVWRFDQQGKC